MQKCTPNKKCHLKDLSSRTKNTNHQEEGEPEEEWSEHVKSSTEASFRLAEEDGWGLGGPPLKIVKKNSLNIFNILV